MRRGDPSLLFSHLCFLGSSLDERVVVERDDSRSFAVPRTDKAVQPRRHFGLRRSRRLFPDDCFDLMAYAPRQRFVEVILVFCQPRLPLRQVGNPHFDVVIQAPQRLGQRAFGSPESFGHLVGQVFEDWHSRMNGLGKPSPKDEYVVHLRSSSTDIACLRLLFSHIIGFADLST